MGNCHHVNIVDFRNAHMKKAHDKQTQAYTSIYLQQEGHENYICK